MISDFKNSSEDDRNRWLIPIRQSGGVCRLLCIPYAGGASHIFYKWKTLLDDTIDAYSVQLPGRGKRLQEAAVTNLGEVVMPLAIALEPLLDKPLAIFGHSMGGLIAFELARQCRHLYGVLPIQLFLSGCRGPKQIGLDQAYSQLDDSAFLHAVNRYGSIPNEVFANADLQRIVLPALRADYSIIESYQYREDAPLDCPVAVFGGLQDTHVSTADLDAWEEQTTKAFQRHLMRGGHFFLRDSEVELLAILNWYLTRIR